MKTLITFIQEHLVKNNVSSYEFAEAKIGDNLYWLKNKQKYTLEKPDDESADSYPVGVCLGETTKGKGLTWLYLGRKRESSIFKDYCWAKEGTKLYTDINIALDKEDGYKNTQEVLSKYKGKELDKTIWSIPVIVKDFNGVDVYIPSEKELYDIIRRKKLLSIIGNTYPHFLSSTNGVITYKSKLSRETSCVSCGYNNGKCNDGMSGDKSYNNDVIILIKLKNEKS